MKVEGALKLRHRGRRDRSRPVLGPDGFFDGQIFDPDEIEAYIEAARSRNLAVPPPSPA